MAEKSQAEQKEAAAKKAGGKDAGQAEAQARSDVETEVGYSGEKVDPFPNSAYSQESGPDSPSAAETRDALADAEREAREQREKDRS